VIELLQSVVAAALSFPTFIFTVILGLVILFWIISSATGVGDSIEGATGGVLDGFADGLMEGAADGLLDGALDGAVDGALDGALDGAVDGAAEGIGEAGTLGRVLGCLGLTAVPVTLFLSILVLISWGLSMLLSKLVERHIGVGTITAALGTAIVLGALFIGLIFTSWAVRPLKPLFRSDRTIQRRDFVGKLCTVTTLRVDSGFGMAEHDDGQAGLLLQVRCNQPNSLTRGSRARVVRYDPSEDVLHLAPQPVEAPPTDNNPDRRRERPAGKTTTKES
jgi:hypothetical protein